MKTIMCYGDSLTWGFNPADRSRYPFEQRWPGVLQNELGSGVRVIEEALNGRTAATDSWVLPNRDGRAMLGPLLESHAPLDLVIMMLGTNDVGPTYCLSASEVAFGCATLVWTVQKSQAGPGGAAPEILLIAPPRLGELSGLMELFFKGAEDTSSGLARAYRLSPKLAAVTSSTLRASSRPASWTASTLIQRDNGLWDRSEESCHGDSTGC